MDAQRTLRPRAGLQAEWHPADGIYPRWVKQCFDLLGASILIALLSPLLLIIGLLVRVFIGPPVIFRQKRTGFRTRPFVLYKYRTLAAGTVPGGSSASTPLTRLGRFLRASSLDELPQLFNVVRGSMSLVGPRPLLSEYVPLYTADQSRRHEVRPGITGWAQVNGRNANEWEKRFELDLWYVDHISFLLDLKILWFTVGSVIRGEGTDQPGWTGSQRFDGRS